MIGFHIKNLVMCLIQKGDRFMNKILVKIWHFLIVVVGFFLLTGSIALKIILATDLPHEIFINHINHFRDIYYSVISYNINLLIWFCVPFIDLIIVVKMPKSDKKMKIYLWLVFFIYTSFFVLRLTTLQA